MFLSTLGWSKVQIKLIVFSLDQCWLPHYPVYGSPVCCTNYHSVPSCCPVPPAPLCQSAVPITILYRLAVLSPQHRCASLLYQLTFCTLLLSCPSSTAVPVCCNNYLSVPSCCPVPPAPQCQSAVPINILYRLAILSFQHRCASLLYQLTFCTVLLSCPSSTAVPVCCTN